jgi:16S rRNA processing protein RimM
MDMGPGRRSPEDRRDDTEQQWLSAGHVGRPHGLDGSFYVTQPRAVLLEQGRTLFVDGRAEQIVRRAGTDARPIVRLASCTDRSAAEALRGRDLLVPRADAPALEQDEWWPEELEGCRVVDGDRQVGVVRSLLALPSCEVLEVVRDTGGDDLLVPLVRDAVRDVDVVRRRIDVDMAFLGEGGESDPSAADPAAGDHRASDPTRDDGPSTPGR